MFNILLTHCGRHYLSVQCILGQTLTHYAVSQYAYLYLSSRVLMKPQTLSDTQVLSTPSPRMCTCSARFIKLGIRCDVCGVGTVR